MTDAEKLEKIRELAAAMDTIQDEYAVGLAADILAVIDGSVTGWQIETKARKCRTVGDALIAAKAMPGT